MEPALPLSPIPADFQAPKGGSPNIVVDNGQYHVRVKDLDGNLIRLIASSVEEDMGFKGQRYNFELPSDLQAVEVESKGQNYLYQIMKVL